MPAIFLQKPERACIVADCTVQTADIVHIFEFKLSGTGRAEDAIAQ